MQTSFFQSLFVVMLFVAYPCLGQTDIKSDQRQGVERNPPGVAVTLRAAEGKASFHLFEPIPIELVFQSSHPSSYSIELNEHMNFAGQTDWFQISPEETVYLTSSQKQVRLVACCAIDRRYLSAQPMILKRELTDYFRFESPGTYSVYYATERVFRGFGKHNDFGRSPLKLTSNVMTITILPDDPDWDVQQLASTLQKLQDPAVRARYNKVLRHPSNLNSDFYLGNYVAQTELVKAQKALNALDTEQAIRERIRLRTKDSQHDIDRMRNFDEAFPRDEPLLSSTARPDLMAAQMRERAEAPDFGVDITYVYRWIIFVRQRDCPDVFRPRGTAMAYPWEGAASCRTNDAAGTHEIIETLKNALTQKHGEAADLTALTLQVLKSQAKLE